MEVVLSIIAGWKYLKWRLRLFGPVWPSLAAILKQIYIFAMWLRAESHMLIGGELYTFVSSTA